MTLAARCVGARPLRCFAKYPACVCVLLFPATAYANGLHALADFAALLTLGAAVTFFFVLVLLIASAIIGRKNAPKRPWKRAYGWAALVVGSLCELYLLPLAVTAVVVLADAKIGGGWLVVSAVILAALLGGVSIGLAVRVLRRNPREKVRS